VVQKKFAISEEHVASIFLVKVSVARTQQEAGGALFPYKIHSNITSTFPSELFLQRFPAKVSMDFSFMSCALHDPLTASFPI
jgi:hypothetical protein